MFVAYSNENKQNQNKTTHKISEKNPYTKKWDILIDSPVLKNAIFSGYLNYHSQITALVRNQFLGSL